MKRINTAGIALNASMAVVDACVQNVVSLCNFVYQPLSLEKLEKMKKNLELFEKKVDDIITHNTNNNDIDA